MVNGWLAKSEGNNKCFIKHSILVKDVALEIAKQSSTEIKRILDNEVIFENYFIIDDDGNNIPFNNIIFKNKERLNIPDEWEQIITGIIYASLLHDVGKLTIDFQQYLHTNKKQPHYEHNEIGWAYLKQRFQNISLNKNIKKYILDSVFWHHGIYNNRDIDAIDMIDVNIFNINKNDNIDSVKNMDNYLSILNILTNTITHNNSDSKPPKYYDYDNLNDSEISILLFIRSCIVGADRLVSNLENEKFLLSKQGIEQLVADNLSMNSNIKFGVIDFNNNNNNNYQRHIEQLDIIEQTKTHHTNLIKAPAGFGKSRIGCLWGLKHENKRKLIWLCPRNMVADSVYNSLVELMESLNISDISIELYYSGKKIKPDNIIDDDNNNNSFNSDIIVTNIDSFLFTSINNNDLQNLYLITNANVIFDEFHEIVSDSAMFSIFNTIMKLRHDRLKSHTLLLSATPSLIHELWTTNNEINVLPNNNSHYNACHNQKYKFNVVETLDISDIQVNDNNLILFNSIYNSQFFYKKILNGIGKLIHSKFEKSRRNEDFKDLLEIYGKKSNHQIRPNISGTPIIKASLDISLKKLYESLSSPESTLQSWGRCCRYGEYNDSTVTVFMNIEHELYDNQSEDFTRNMLYDKNIRQKWFDCIKKINGTYITLNEIYIIYNKFNNDNRIVINEYINNKLRESKNYAKKIIPRKKVKNNSNKTSVIKSGGNVLRSIGEEVFYILINNKTFKFTEYFSHSAYKNIRTDFHIDDSLSTEMGKKFKSEHTNKCYNTYNLEKYPKLFQIKKKDIDSKKLLEKAKFSDTPFLRLDNEYDDDLGEISSDKLNKLNK